ncbi:MAG: metallophosphoesterase, partial [Verrucomicrobia bacterium]|nr:metallophosphoesterase [Verrucomicrobiota bacterium]
MWLMLLGLPGGALGDVLLIPAGSTWRYLDNGTNPGTAWREGAFNDAGWAWGPAPLGYGDGDEATVVGYGPDPASRYITTYFRKPFTIEDPALFTALNLRVLRDDGVVVYLNGVEVFRNNLPTGTITSTTRANGSATSQEEVSLFLTSLVATTPLVAGANVVAVEIHQQSAGSSDISFDLELVGLQPGLPVVTRGPYLQTPTPDSMVVRWRTSVPTDSRVRLGTNVLSLDLTATVAGSRVDHSVVLSGLLPNTRYYYSVGHSAGDLVAGADHVFFTAPEPGSAQPMRFWILGDAGTGTASQSAVRDAFYAFAGSRYTDLILLLGDNAYNSGTDAEYQRGMFDMYPAIFRTTAVLSTIGNHDTAGSSNPNLATTPYFKIFDAPSLGQGGGVPSGTLKYYSFNYGNVHFVCLDSMTSDRSPGAPMLTWLEQDLAQNDAEWLIAFFHHPPYTKGSHDSDDTTDSSGRLRDMRVHAMPLLEAYGVDLVLGGHSHSYERSYLLDGHYGTSDTLTPAMKLDGGDGRDGGTGPYLKAGGGPVTHGGAVYAVTGSAGKISGGDLNHPAMFVSLNQLGSMIVEVHGPRLDARFLTSTGLTNDHFTLLKETANLAPSAVLSSPSSGAVLPAGSTVVMTADALDSDGTVESVTFLADGVPLGTDSIAPYRFDWLLAPAGTHLLSAVATDNLGAQGGSALVPVTMAGPISAGRSVWQIGNDDQPNVTPYDPSAEFSMQNGKNDKTPGLVTRLPGDPVFDANPAGNPGPDDDFYFAGVYPPGFNGLAAPLEVPNDEPASAWERGHTEGDRTNRIHLQLSPDQVTVERTFRLSLEFTSGGYNSNNVTQPGFGVHDMVIRFRNGAGQTTQLDARRLVQASSLVVDFNAAEVLATAGPNTLEIVRTGPVVSGVSSWIRYDYVRLEQLTASNIAPQLVQPPSLFVDEHALLQFSLNGADPDGPSGALVYSLVSGPAGLAVTSSGVLSWIPTESDGPGVHPVTVRVTDAGIPVLSDTKSFTVTVNEVIPP